MTLNGISLLMNEGGFWGGAPQSFWSCSVPDLGHLPEWINPTVCWLYHRVRGWYPLSDTVRGTLRATPLTSALKPHGFSPWLTPMLCTTPHEVRGLVPKLCVPLCCCRWADTKGSREWERGGGGGLHPADLLPCLTWKSALWRLLGTVSGKTSYFTRAPWSRKGNVVHHDSSLKVIRHEIKLSSFTWGVMLLFNKKKKKWAKRAIMLLNWWAQSKGTNGSWQTLHRDV